MGSEHEPGGHRYLLGGEGLGGGSFEASPAAFSLRRARPWVRHANTSYAALAANLPAGRASWGVPAEPGLMSRQ